MSLKDFFRLTKGKIVLVIILCFFAIYVGAVVLRLEIEIEKGTEVNGLKFKAFRGLELILISPIYLAIKYRIVPIFFSEDIARYITLGDMLLITVVFILLIFYWYFLSCLIVFVYGKLEEKWRQLVERSKYPYDY